MLRVHREFNCGINQTSQTSFVFEM